MMAYVLPVVKATNFLKATENTSTGYDSICISGSQGVDAGLLEAILDYTVSLNPAANMQDRVSK